LSFCTRAKRIEARRLLALPGGSGGSVSGARSVSSPLRTPLPSMLALGMRCRIGLITVLPWSLISVVPTTQYYKVLINFTGLTAKVVMAFARASLGKWAYLDTSRVIHAGVHPEPGWNSSHHAYYADQIGWLFSTGRWFVKSLLLYSFITRVSLHETAVFNMRDVFFCFNFIVVHDPRCHLWSRSKVQLLLFCFSWTSFEDLNPYFFIFSYQVFSKDCMFCWVLKDVNQKVSTSFFWFIF
jgi:hypothetical protein